MTTYSERAYFDGDHCQHVADMYEEQRMNRIRQQAKQYAPLRQHRRRDNVIPYIVLLFVAFICLVEPITAGLAAMSTGEVTCCASD